MTDDGLVEDVEEFPPAPFSFKLMVVLAVVYLGWRLIQGMMWLWEWLT